MRKQRCKEYKQEFFWCSEIKEAKKRTLINRASGAELDRLGCG